MGITVEQWRTVIGRYGCRINSHLPNTKGDGSTLFDCLFAAAVICYLLVIGGVEINPGPYPCKLCPTVPETITSSIRHQQMHILSRNFEFFCPVENCLFLTSSYGSLRFHASTFHRQLLHQDPAATTRIACPSENCPFSTASLWEFVQHLCEHLNQKTSIECPIQGCTFSKHFTAVSTFRVHLSQYHKGWKDEGCPAMKECYKVIDAPDPPFHCDDDNFEDVTESSDFPDFEEEFDESYDADLLNDELVYDSIAKFYLNLYAEDVLPATVIQSICDAISFLSSVAHARLDLALSAALKKLEIEEDKIKKLCYDMKLADLMFVSHHKSYPGPSFTSDYYRKKYFTENFGYLPPINVNLDEDDVTTDANYQYIPPTRTLQKLFEDPSIQEEIKASFVEQPNDPNVVSDYKSGSLFKSENHSPKEIHLFVYADGVNAVLNALGAAKNKFKMIAMYFTLGNFSPHIRSRVDTKFAVLLIRESIFKKFKPAKCFERVLAEFKQLETEGIMFLKEKIKVVVQLMLGDNLGQNMIGGFIECFSVDYFCRFCVITKKAFQDNPHLTNPQRTIEHYEQCVQENLQNNDIDHCQGVKNHSPFNCLQNFHAISHLAPCLAHDLFEGVVSWDMAGIIARFVSKGWFSYELLNRRIKEFQCKSGDAPNKPACVPKNGEKLGGHAIQNWTMLRLFPFIIGDKIQDYEDPGWRLYLQLKELCEYFCAPSLVKTDIPFVQDVLLPAYFENRKLVLCQEKYNLKPKHHFMAHYCELYLRLGSLIYLWTMSYEQKHKYYKQVMRMCKNFINPERTCAIRYQLYFCSLTSGGPLLQKGRKETQPKPLFLCQFQHEIVVLLNELHLENDWRCCKGVQNNGLNYETNDLLLMSSEGKSITAGIIKVIATRSDSLFFVLEIVEAEFNSIEGVYYLPQRSTEKYLWQSASDLAHPVRQAVYIHRQRQCFSIKHVL